MTATDDDAYGLAMMAEEYADAAWSRGNRRGELLLQAFDNPAVAELMGVEWRFEVRNELAAVLQRRPKP